MTVLGQLVVAVIPTFLKKKSSANEHAFFKKKSFYTFRTQMKILLIVKSLSFSGASFINDRLTKILPKV